jgi:hypothetical protein
LVVTWLQILRGLKRLLLGLGQLPGTPSQLACVAFNKSTVQLTWQAPGAAGHPAFHKYVLERRRLSTGQAVADGGTASDGSGAGNKAGAVAEQRWELAGEPDDEDGSWLDSPPARGTYRYRLTAWSAYGHSEYALSSSTCTVRAVQRQPQEPAPTASPLAPSEVAALLAAVAAGNMSAGQAMGSYNAGLAANSSSSSSSAAVWSWSAASSAAVVVLTVLFKASQLHVGAVLLALWRKLAAGSWLAGQQSTENFCAGAELEGSNSALLGAGGSQATLAGNGQQIAAAGEQQQQAQLAVGGPVVAGGQLPTQLSGQLSSSQSAAALAELPASQEDELFDEEAEQLQLAIERGTHCAHPGCHRRFDRLRDLRRKMEVSLSSSNLGCKLANSTRHWRSVRFVLLGC